MPVTITFKALLPIGADPIALKKAGPSYSFETG